jgi:DNA modification methylase
VTGMLRTERDVVETLAGKAVTLDEIYDMVRVAGVHERDGGTATIPTHGSDTVWRRRVRNALQSLKRAGRAERVGDGMWVIDGTRDQPTAALLVLMPGELGPVELHLADAAQHLDRLAADGVSVDLILTDPPWALSRGRAAAAERGGIERIYARDGSKVLRDGYVEVDPGAYTEFTVRWVTAAAGLLAHRPGSYLAVVTGPQQAARIQVAAEDAGLTFVNQVVAKKTMPLPTTRRFSHGHYVVTICCAGPLTSKRRFFHIPAELPTAASGRPYPRSWIPDVGTSARRNALRYDNSLPLTLVTTMIRALTPGPDTKTGAPWQSTVVDPMVGGGTTAVASWMTGRRFIGGDLNGDALKFTIGRISVETTSRWATSGLARPAGVQER